ncbi:MAG: hypothetical protein H6713_02655 [Myxococcales bacterium]|nr:hypothetical protein [Myxococcales bacterium]
MQLTDHRASSRRRERALPRTRARRRAALALPLLGALALPACAGHNLSRTVGKGNGEFHSSLGGPFFDSLGPALPTPNVNLGGRYGVTDWMDVDGGFNATALAYSILAFDVAANFQLYRKPQALAVASSVRLYSYGDLDDAPGYRGYPELGLHLGGPVLRWLHLYGGVTSTFQFAPPEGKPPVFLTPFFGTEFLIPPRGETNRQHGLALHLGWTNPWQDATAVVSYQPGYGGLALYLNYRVRFGGLDR